MKKYEIIEYKNYGFFSYMIIVKDKTKYLVIYSKSGVTYIKL